jgi:hypothetical protein
VEGEKRWSEKSTVSAINEPKTEKDERWSIPVKADAQPAEAVRSPEGHRHKTLQVTGS